MIDELAERRKRLARNFAAEWLRPSDPDHADPALLDTLQITMVAFFACASGLKVSAGSAQAPETPPLDLEPIKNQIAVGVQMFIKPIVLELIAEVERLRASSSDEQAEGQR